MSINLALVDAYNNSQEYGAKTTITMKGSKSFTGMLDHKPLPGSPTVFLNTDDGGWETITIEDIAAVGSHR